MNTCSTCIHWEVKDDDENNGECRVNPPVVHIVMVPTRTIQGDGVGAQVLSLFPTTNKYVYCGYHEGDDNPQDIE